jgi:hypothetical protein
MKPGGEKHEWDAEKRLKLGKKDWENKWFASNLKEAQKF